MSSKIILPILNKSVTTFKGPTWYLSENVSIETINEDEYFGISDYLKESYRTQIQEKSKCARIENIKPEEGEEIAKVEASKIAFVLNFFKRKYPVALSFALQITKKRKFRLDNVYDLSIISDASLSRKQRYKIQENVKRDLITQFYKIISTVCDKEKSVLLTLNRFNSALFRRESLDKIIDITISLETLISGTTELRNKFSLFNAWSAGADNELRGEYYELLLKLYDARSAIVHGSSMTDKEYRKKIEPIINNWDKIIEIAKKSIGYYLLYKYQKETDTWYDHQKKLVLGLEKRIV